MAKNKGRTKREMRNLRAQQIIFIIIGIIVIVSMVASLLVKY
jgi:hypothetical protein